VDDIATIAGSPNCNEIADCTLDVTNRHAASLARLIVREIEKANVMLVDEVTGEQSADESGDAPSVWGAFTYEQNRRHQEKGPPASDSAIKRRRAVRAERAPTRGKASELRASVG